MADCDTAPADAPASRYEAALGEDGDAALVARCRQGDAAGWATLVRRYQRLVYTVPRRAGLSEAEAADVFQFSFARLVESLPRLEDPSRVRAWLVTTARRESLRLLELRARQAPAHAPGFDRNGDAGGDAGVDDRLARLPDPDPLPEAQLEQLQQLDRLRSAVLRLDERSRRFVELVLLQDPAPSYAEIAAQLGIAEGSIGPTRARCLDKLRRLMGTP